jgi:hypothetical protein
MQVFSKGANGAQYLRITRSEGEQFGLYGDATSARYEIERGLGTSRSDEAKVMLTMLETARDAMHGNAAAGQLLRDLLRHKTLTFQQALGMWTEAQAKLGGKKNASLQLERMLAMRARILLAPLVAVWGGGSKGAAAQRTRNVSKVRGLIPEDSEMTADEFTSRTVETYLRGLLDSITQRSGKPMTKRTMLYHEMALNSFGKWLLSDTAARAAGLAEGQYVIARNPVEVLKADGDVTFKQTNKDRQQWKKQRVWYTPEEAQKLVQAATGETRALLALMFGSGVEMGAVYNTQRSKGAVGPVLFKRDFLVENGNFTRWFIVPEDLKTEDRSGRALEVPETGSFDYWGVVEAYLKTLRQNDPFLSHDYDYYQRHFTKVMAEVGLKRQHGELFHACRRSFAQVWKPLAMAGRAGSNSHGLRDEAWLKQQLGHSEDSTLLHTTYTRSLRKTGQGERVLDEATSQERRGLKLA